MLPHRHKRGDTFNLAGPLRREGDASAMILTGWSIRAHLRRKRDDHLIEELTAEIADPVTGIVRISSAGTEEWPVGRAVLDVEFTAPGGEVVSTETADIEIVRDVTHG